MSTNMPTAARKKKRSVRSNSIGAADASAGTWTGNTAQKKPKPGHVVTGAKMQKAG